MEPNPQLKGGSAGDNRIRVLLVDDDPDYAFLIQDYLRDVRAQYDIAPVTSVAQAIENFREDRIDVCLCDYMLGAQTGFDLLRHARAVSSSIPIIILTNLGNDLIDIEAMHLGAMDYLPKEDISASMLDRSIRYALERKRALVERLDLEVQLRQSQKLETIGTLAGGIAHDFNNILTPIMAYTDMVLARNPDDAVTQEDLSRVLDAANRAKDLVRQILTFSRHSEGQRRAVMPGPIINEALKLLRASLPATVEIQERIDSNTHQIVMDPTQLHQIIMNLAVNASLAMSERGGTLTVELHNETLGANAEPRHELAPGNYVRLRVSDTGCGMDGNTMARIFEPFFTTRGVGEGTGLGLPVVHGIVRGCGGNIFVTSTPNEGTQFELYFPETAAGAERESRQTSGEIGGTEHVLLVDDEQMVANACAKSLSRYGYRVTVCTTAVDGLRELQQRPYEFDLLLTDYTMPLLTGAQFAQMAKQIRADLPVIMMTGFNTVVNEHNLSDYGIDEIVAKPLVGWELAIMVRRVIDASIASAP